MDKHRILVIDEHKSDRERYQTLLNSALHIPVENIVCCVSEEEAATAVSDSLSTPFSLVFMDMRFSNGVDALQIAQNLRALDEHIILVFISAHNDFSAEELDHKLGHDVLLLKKPINADEFTQITRNMCRQWQQNITTKEELAAVIQPNPTDVKSSALKEELTHSLSIVEKNMAHIRQTDETIQTLHSQLQTLESGAKTNGHASDQQLEDIRRALNRALNEYRLRCAEPELLIAAMHLRQLKNERDTN